jgi:NADH dehydrogenase
MKQDFRHIDPTKARVLLVEGGPRILPSYPEDLSQKAVEQLEHLGVEVHVNARVTDVQPGYVMLGRAADRRGGDAMGGRRAGIAAGQAAGPGDGQTRLRGGRSAFESGRASGDLRLRRPGVCCRERTQIPGVAQPAMQMGDHVAQMIGQDIDGKPRTNFHYFDKGDMATIGRLAAVAKVEWPFKAHWGGFMAWATGWRCISSS